ncbi:DUF2254 domain-containing protein [Rhizobium leguminosarum]|uniref:DUF2254 domain-containing protein n=1 Tax=Rhizobium leguminosarum TaxID=384 RepID=UPI001FE08F48|nr:DUF2254 domain-containing protein [Rhizobium leguminosarum]
MVAVNLNALVALGENTNCVIELVPRVGDFVGTDEALFRLYGPSLPDDRALKRWSLVRTAIRRS